MKILPPILASLAVAAVYAYSEYDNFAWRLAFVLGLICMPFVFRVGKGGRSFRFLWPALLLTGSLLFIRSSTVFYFACSFAILFFWEASLGKRSLLAFFLLAIMSPFVSNMAYVWSFPIRLQLSQWATSSLRFLGFDVEAAGNIVILNGQEFAVDPACMGLQMLITSLVLAIFMIARTAYQKAQPYSFLTIGSSLLLMLFLTVFANFIRLLSLIVFRILPNNPLHDFIGLLSLSLYALLPFYLLWTWWSTRQPERPSKSNQVLPLASWQASGFAVLVGLLFAVGLQFRQPPQVDTFDLAQIQVSGYQAKFSKLGVLQLKKEDALVYIKPPVRAFQGGHDPRICWQGSGYEFTRIDTFSINDYIVYQAVLKKEDDQLYTAWWYDDGSIKTISEWKWRWNTLRQKSQFRLLNVTSGSEAGLHKLVTAWL